MQKFVRDLVARRDHQNMNFTSSFAENSLEPKMTWSLKRLWGLSKIGIDSETVRKVLYEKF
jgi:hypothetical protein